jgi:hypothetical protein
MMLEVTYDRDEMIKTSGCRDGMMLEVMTEMR